MVVLYPALTFPFVAPICRSRSMALFKSQLVTQVSGSVGGTTYAHTKSGMYMRGRGIPTNPQTARQSQIRDAMSMYSAMWSTVLTQAQRDAWNQYAEAVLVANALGDQIQISGQNHYVRANVSRAAANAQLSPSVPLTTIADAPTMNMLPNAMPISAAIDSTGTGTLSISFVEGEAWSDFDTAAILIYVGRPRNAGVNYFKGPYRLAGLIPGDGITPPTTPVDVTTALESVWALTPGQVCKVKAVLSNGATAAQPTGLSGPVFAEAIIT